MPKLQIGLRFYATEKKALKYDFCYRNSYSSKLYTRARTNALQLEEHKVRGNKTMIPHASYVGKKMKI